MRCDICGSMEHVEAFHVEICNNLTVGKITQLIPNPTILVERQRFRSLVLEARKECTPHDEAEARRIDELVAKILTKIEVE